MGMKIGRHLRFVASVAALFASSWGVAAPIPEAIVPQLAGSSEMATWTRWSPPRQQRRFHLHQDAMGTIASTGTDTIASAGTGFNKGTGVVVTGRSLSCAFHSK